MKFESILSKLNNNKASVLYVVTNAFLLVVGALKSYLLMKYLIFSSVGAIAMLQALIDLVGLCHLGFISGAYRQYFSAEDAEKQKLNDFLYTFFAALLLGLSTLGLLYHFIFNQEGSFPFLLIGYAGGVGLLIKSWVNNLLIANKEIRIVNILNNTGAFISLCFVLMIPYWGLAAAVFSLLSPTICFVTVAFYKYKSLLPRRIFFSKAMAISLLKIGMIPFLSGIFLKAVDQFERWGIIKSFGLEQLGQYNIVLLYSSTFLLVPLSIHSLFLPRVITAFNSDGNMRQQKLYAAIKLYAVIILSYCAIVFLLTYLLLQPIISLVLPKYLPYVNYIWYILPFLLFSSLINVLDIYYTAINKYKYMFWSYFIGALTMAILIYFVSQQKVIIFVPIVKSISILTIFIISLLGVLVGRKIISPSINH